MLFDIQSSLSLGPSRKGKTEWAKSLFKHPLELKIGSLTFFPDSLRAFKRGFHDRLILDDVRDLQFVVDNQEKLQGKCDCFVEFGSTAGGTCAYHLDLFGIPVVATINFSTKNLLDAHDLAVCGRSNLRSCAKAGEGTRPFPATGKTHASHNVDVGRSFSPQRSNNLYPPHQAQSRAKGWSLRAIPGRGNTGAVFSEKKHTRSPGFVRKIKSDMHVGADCGRRKDDQYVPVAVDVWQGILAGNTGSGAVEVRHGT